MKVIWVANGPIERISRVDKRFGNSDIGWISSALSELIHCQDINIVIVFPQIAEKNTIIGKTEGIKYYGVYQKKKHPWQLNHEFENSVKDILKSEKPDVIHIWGTEYAHSLDVYNAAKLLGLQDKVCVHIQGLTSVIAKYYKAGIPEKVCRSKTIRDLIRRSSINDEQRKFALRGANEISLLKGVKYVMGRTDWDYFHTKAINPDVKYFKCHEIMRPVFSSYKWEYTMCEKNSIFITQGYYPIKGFHVLIEAIALVKKNVPNVKVYVAGEDIINKSRIRQSYYAKYMKKMMIKHDVNDCFVFLGYQNVEQMAELYQRVNVFVLPSFEENSPNSLAEALIVGTPCVASYAGGISSMTAHGDNCYLYQHDDAVMLAGYIETILKNKDIAEKLSNNTFYKVREEHIIKNFVDSVLEIYTFIINNEF